MFTHTSAATVAASRKAALEVSVRRKFRSGVSRFRAHAVRPEKRPATVSLMTSRFFLQSGYTGRDRWPPARSRRSSTRTRTTTSAPLGKDLVDGRGVIDDLVDRH